MIRPTLIHNYWYKIRMFWNVEVLWRVRTCETGCFTSVKWRWLVIYCKDDRQKRVLCVNFKLKCLMIILIYIKVLNRKFHSKFINIINNWIKVGENPYIGRKFGVEANRVVIFFLKIWQGYQIVFKWDQSWIFQISVLVACFKHVLICNVRLDICSVRIFTPFYNE